MPNATVPGVFRLKAYSPSSLICDRPCQTLLWQPRSASQAGSPGIAATGRAMRSASGPATPSRTEGGLGVLA